MIHINQYLVSSSEKSNAKDELGIIYILCNLSCDIYFHNKNGFHVLIVSTITVSAYTSVCPFTFYYILYTTQRLSKYLCPKRICNITKC